MLVKTSSPVNIYLFKVNNGNTRKIFNVTKKPPERHQQRRYEVFIVNFEDILHVF